MNEITGDILVAGNHYSLCVANNIKSFPIYILYLGNPWTGEVSYTLDDNLKAYSLYYELENS